MRLCPTKTEAEKPLGAAAGGHRWSRELWYILLVTINDMTESGGATSVFFVQHLMGACQVFSRERRFAQAPSLIVRARLARVLVALCKANGSGSLDSLLAAQARTH